MTTPLYQLNIDHKEINCDNDNLNIIEMISDIIQTCYYMHTIPDHTSYIIYISQDSYVITILVVSLIVHRTIHVVAALEYKNNYIKYNYIKYNYSQ